MNAVCDAPNRHKILGNSWPQRAPHRTGHAAMFAADPVQVRGHSDGQRGHVESGPRGVRVLTQAEKRVTREAQLFPVATEVALDQRDREDVVAGENPSARHTRTPPMPSSISWRRRIS